jgi:hypothetical protein
MSTTATQIVTDFMVALEAKQFEKAATYLADDFRFIGWTPLPLNKDQFIRLSSELAYGMPNLSYNFHDLHEVDALPGEGNRERAAIRVTGTQVNEFVLVPLGLPPIPQTAQSVALPEEHWEYVVRDDTIVTIDVEPVPGGGISGLLHQFGINIPIIQ